MSMKTGANTSEWYLVLGSGPTALDGTSTQEAKVALFRLKNLTTNPRGAFQIPDAVPTATAPKETGRFLLSPAANNGFVSNFTGPLHFYLLQRQSFTGASLHGNAKHLTATPAFY